MSDSMGAWMEKERERCWNVAHGIQSEENHKNSHDDSSKFDRLEKALDNALNNYNKKDHEQYDRLCSKLDRLIELLEKQ